MIGYELSDLELKSGPYPVFRSEGDPRAGLVEIVDEKLEGAWAPYVGVADLAAILRRAEELGGEILLAPSEELGQGRVALLADPGKAAFFVYQLKEGKP